MLENKLCIIGLAILTVIPWKIFYNKYKLYKQRYEDELLFKERHNFVLMYTANKGMSGWPPNKNRILTNIKDVSGLYALYEPIIFFVKSAEKSLDIAYMMISIQKIYDALLDAQKRGVKIRLLLNFDHCNNNLTPIQKCLKAGIKVELYISQKSNMESIMHYKYMVKDYEEGKRGYVLNGSMNLTRSAFLENYEHIVFSSDLYLVKSIHDNFEQCWNYIELENQNLLNKTTLLDVNLL